jgi:phenylpropionate dioxygenase-like ring-hydroxylating dioxygenase large terminal subunit
MSTLKHDNAINATPVNERCPGMSYQDIVKSDYVRAPDGGVPKVLAPVVDIRLPTDDIPFERYTSQQWFDLEMERVWKKTWQMACRLEHIPEPGDYYVYEIGLYSILVVRTATGIKGYYNSCLHRGTKLKASSAAGYTGNKLQCPYHGWTWNLDGELQTVPCAWEFEHLDYAANRLPEVLVDTWAGFVFINMDENAGPLMDYLEVLPEHMSHWWPYDDWYVASHVEKELSCNWKTAQEAFMEAYHTPVTHPELTRVVGDWNMQHDIYGPHTSRDLCAMAVSSPSLPEPIPQETMLENRLAGGPQTKRRGTIPEGQSARSVIAARMREDTLAKYGKDLSALSDAEVIDSLKYNLFPNLFIYSGPGLPQLHRIRPVGNDPHHCVMEFIRLMPKPKGEPCPEPARPFRLKEEESFATVPGTDSFSATVLDQDTNNLRWQHEGMRTSRKGAETLSSYQESRIRHFHMTLERYLER